MDDKHLKLEERTYPRRDFALESDEIYKDEIIDSQENGKKQLQYFENKGDPEMAGELLNRVLPALEGKVVMAALRPDVVLVLRDGWPDCMNETLGASRNGGTRGTIQLSSEGFGQLGRSTQTLSFASSGRVGDSDMASLRNDPASQVLDNLPDTVAIRLGDEQHLCLSVVGTRERSPVQLLPRKIGNLNQKFLLVPLVPDDLGAGIRIVLAQNADFSSENGELNVFSQQSSPTRGRRTYGGGGSGSFCLTVDGSSGGVQRILLARCQQGDINQEFIIDEDSGCIASRGMPMCCMSVTHLDPGGEVHLNEKNGGPEQRFVITERMLYVHQEILSRTSPLLKQLEDVELPGTFKRISHGSVCLDVRELRKLGDRLELTPPQAREEQLARIQDALHVLYNPEEAISTKRSGLEFDWTSPYSPHKEHHRGDALNGVFHFLAWANVEYTPVLRRIATMLEKHPSIGCLKLARKYGYEKRPPDQYLLDFDRWLLHTFSCFEASELKRFRDYEDVVVNVKGSSYEYKGLDKQTKLEIHERRIRSLEHLIKNTTEEDVKRVRGAKTRPGLGFVDPAQVFSKTQFRDRGEDKLVPVKIKGGYQ